MPFKSQAQRRLFYAKVKSGEMKKTVLGKWEEETTGKLPERVKKGKK